MNLLWRPTSKALGRQKYSEITTAQQCHNNDSAKRWVFSLVKKRVYVDEVRMCDGRRSQADGAATEKELLESWRLNRGTIKSPCDVDLYSELAITRPYHLTLTLNPISGLWQALHLTSLVATVLRNGTVDLEQIS